MKLLDTTGGNTKLAKNNLNLALRVAGLSMLPHKSGCPFMDIAGCGESCLQFSGRGVFSNVHNSRQAKLDYFLNNRSAFISQLVRELKNFVKYCAKNNLKPYARLNVLQDVPWETKAYGRIPQQFPEIEFYDYTKVASRLGNTPDNYKLMFSYSPAKSFRKYVQAALESGVPISAVFHGTMPDYFLGRKVFDGDKSDIDNLTREGGIIGLKYKLAKGQAVSVADSKFIVSTLDFRRKLEAMQSN